MSRTFIMIAFAAHATVGCAHTVADTSATSYGTHAVHADTGPFSSRNNTSDVYASDFARCLSAHAGWDGAQEYCEEFMAAGRVNQLPAYYYGYGYGYTPYAR